MTGLEIIVILIGLLLLLAVLRLALKVALRILMLIPGIIFGVPLAILAFPFILAKTLLEERKQTKLHTLTKTQD